MEVNVDVVINIKMSSEGKVQVQTNSDSKVIIGGLLRLAEQTLFEGLDAQQAGKIVVPTPQGRFKVPD